MRQLEAECRKIVDEIQEKFIDLGLDEGNHSDYGDDLYNKQEKFRKEFERLPFEYDPVTLKMPKGGDNISHLEKNDDAMKTEGEEMGRDLEEIFNLLSNKVKHQILLEG
jgi:hypothetical protein